MRQEVEDTVRGEKIVAILRGVPSVSCERIAEALLAGGIRVMEVAQSDADSLSCIEKLRRTVGNRGFVGAGTVISTSIAREVLNVGAQFLVTPHVVEEVCLFAGEQDIAVICGAMTPTEIHRARSLGSRIVKLFPAGPLGPSYIKNLMSPYPDLEVLAVGGVDSTNCQDFLRAGAVGVGIGGALFRQDWTNPDFQRMKDIAADITTRIHER